MKFLAKSFIKFYQKYLRKFHNRKCIYIPTCSEYAILAIEKYGFIKGIYFAYLRIKRCNGALYKGGNDLP